MALLSVSGIAVLTRDSEPRRSSIGMWYTFGIVVYRKDVKEGKQAYDFFEVDLFQRDAPDDLARKLHKGAIIYIKDGDLKNDQYVQDGKDKSRVKIHVSKFEFLDSSIAPAGPVPVPPRYNAEAPKGLNVTTVPSTDLGLPTGEALAPEPEKIEVHYEKPVAQSAPKVDQVYEPEFPDEPPF